jgi:hypothetical protein
MRNYCFRVFRVLRCAGRLIYAPHMLNATALLWFIYFISTKLNLSLWKPPLLYTRDAWSAAFRFHIVIIVNVLLTCLIFFLAAGAIKAGDYTAAVMNIVGCAVYVVRAGGSTTYNDPEVPYRNHNIIRAVLNTSHATGTVYTTDNDGPGMHAVWSYVWRNQIAVVNANLLPALRRLEAGKLDLHELRSTLRESAHSVVLSTTMDDEHLISLAKWLLLPSTPFDAAEKPQPFGRELFYYLHIVELFLFVHRDRLDLDLRRQLCKWRASNRSGANDIGEVDVFGAVGGKDGLVEALRHVGAIFVKLPQLDLMVAKPDKSLLPSYDPSRREGYVGQLWTYCTVSTTTS